MGVSSRCGRPGWRESVTSETLMQVQSPGGPHSGPAMRVLARAHPDIGVVLTELNRVLCEDTHDEHFVTLFLARFDPAVGSVVYAGAGHEAYHIGRAGTVTTLESTGLPLGIDKDATVIYAPPVALALGDVVLFLTDGIAESQAADGTLFGTERALGIVRDAIDRPCREIVDALWTAARDFSAHAPQRDDMTLVIVKA